MQLRQSPRNTIPLLFPSAGKTVATTGFGTFRRSSKVALAGVGWLGTGEEDIPRSASTRLFGLVQSVRYGLLLEVSAGLQTEDHCPACRTGRLSDCPVDGLRRYS